VPYIGMLNNVNGATPPHRASVRCKNPFDADEIR
jgi:hypothetical protein